MTTGRLIYRSLCFYWKSHLGVVAGGAVAAAVLIGALAVGDSVRYSLKRMALARLGQTHLAWHGGDRTITTALAERLTTELEQPVAPMLDLPGLASAKGGQRRAANIHVLGVNEHFWSIGQTPLTLADDTVALNARLAEQLDAKVGDRIVLRLAKPSALPRDIPLGSESTDSISLSTTVGAILKDDGIGRFGLTANQIPPLNAFIPLKQLQTASGSGDRVNTLLVGKDIKAAHADAIVHRLWTLEDADAELRAMPDQSPTHGFELRSRRVFLDPPVVRAAAEGSDAILTYFVNTLSVTEDRSVPYSMVTAYKPGTGPLPPDFRENDIAITQWLADDLKCRVGDELTLRYFVIGSARQLVEQTQTFQIRLIVPTESAQGDRYLMPDFPGLSDVDSTQDWQPGIPIDLKKLRDQDEAYWDKHRGAPKAFVHLNWARKTWGNRYGDLTALRWPADTPLTLEAVRDRTLQTLNPADLGIRFRPVREEALVASASGTEFGGLFIGLSFFVIVAALLLTALLFGFGVERRAAQSGVLIAMGFTPHRVHRMLLCEGAILAILGTGIGWPMGAGYARLVLDALTSVWRDAVGSTTLIYHAETITLISGATGSIFVALFTVAWVLRRQSRQGARQLLASRYGTDIAPAGAKFSATIAGIAIMIALGIALLIEPGRGQSAAGAFFGAGALVLFGFIMACRAILSIQGAPTHLTLTRLAWRNSGRRRSRSLATISMLACGAFLVTAINAFQLQPPADFSNRQSGTGGFALFAQTSWPVYYDLNTQEGRNAFGLKDDEMRDVNVVPMRLRTGDEASCLNLNRPKTPALLGVNPDQFAERGAFPFSQVMEDSTASPWALLTPVPDEEGAYPAMVDEAAATWILHKGIGDIIHYPSDEDPQFKLRVVGLTGGTVLQGFVIMHEQALIQLDPDTAGHRVFLVDAPAAQMEAVKSTFDRAMADVGIETMTTSRRLTIFNAVQNTYLLIFAALGGLGLILGGVGLGLVVLRNVLERRAELAVMRAIGFSKQTLRWGILIEHWALLGMGLMAGMISAGIAVIPALIHSPHALPWNTLGLTLGGVVLSGLIWTAIAARAALHGRLIEGLRVE